MCRLTQIAAWRIRYYDDQGLLGDVERTEGDQRLFTFEQVQRLCAIDRWAAAGWSLDAIRSVLDGDGGEPIDEHIVQTARELHEKFAQLTELHEYACDRDSWRDRVPTYEDLVEDCRRRLGHEASTPHRHRKPPTPPRREARRNALGRRSAAAAAAWGD